MQELQWGLVLNQGGQDCGNPTSLKSELLEFLGACISENKRGLFQEAVGHRTRHVQVVLDTLNDPLDANAALRSCDCFGIQTVHWLQPPQGKRLSRGVAVGASKWLDVRTYPSGSTWLVQNLRDQGIKQFALSTRESAIPLEALPLEKPIALWFGSEEQGLSAATAEAVDGFVTLPMMGFGTHFNLSVAVALALKVVTDRLRRSDLDWKLTLDQQQDLLLEWYATIPKRRKELVRRFLAQTQRDFAQIAPPNLSQRLWEMVR